jgi:hypothetical protein
MKRETTVSRRTAGKNFRPPAASVTGERRDVFMKLYLIDWR